MSTTLNGILILMKMRKFNPFVTFMNVSYSESPSFEKYHDEYIIDADGNETTHDLICMDNQPDKSKSMSCIAKHF